MSNSIHDFQVKNARGKDVNLADYKGKVVLVVNTASKCGLTPQLDKLEKLYKEFNKEGFEIIGGAVEVEELPLLQKIYASGSFTEEIKNQVKDLIKEPIEEDKINLKKILLAHYQQKKDLVKVKKQKEQEINEFIESLC